MTAPSCSVPACDARHYARGWCVSHYRRWARSGDLSPDRPLRTRTGESYRAALRRLHVARGPAAQQRCADCGRPAEFWSYDGTDPDERTTPGRGTRYSLDPTRYRPRCRSCHRRATAGGGRSVQLDADRVAALYRAGASTRGLAAHFDTTPTVINRVLRAHDVSMRPAGRPHRNPHRFSNSAHQPSNSPLDENRDSRSR
jgi:hypothetical protein